MAYNIFQKLISKLKKQTKKYPVGIKIIFLTYFLALLTVGLAFFVCSVYGFIFWGMKADGLLAFFKELISPQAIAGLVLLGKFFVDSDCNDIPDILESDAKEKKGCFFNDRMGNR